MTSLEGTKGERTCDRRPFGYSKYHHGTRSIPRPQSERFDQQKKVPRSNRIPLDVLRPSKPTVLYVVGRLARGSQWPRAIRLGKPSRAHTSTHTPFSPRSIDSTSDDEAKSLPQLKYM